MNEIGMQIKIRVGITHLRQFTQLPATMTWF